MLLHLSPTPHHPRSKDIGYSRRVRAGKGAEIQEVGPKFRGPGLGPAPILRGAPWGWGRGRWAALRGYDKEEVFPPGEHL